MVLSSDIKVKIMDWLYIVGLQYGIGYGIFYSITQFSITTSIIIAWILGIILVYLIGLFSMLSYSQTGAPTSISRSTNFLITTLILSFLIATVTYRVYMELGFGILFYIACVPTTIAIIISGIIIINFISSIIYKRGKSTDILEKRDGENINILLESLKNNQS